MPYYFQKCCFDSENSLVIECDRMTCLNGNHKFEEYLFRCKHDDKLSKRFYCLNRKQLGEYWHCVINDHDQCDICKEFAEVFEHLKDAYFFNPNESSKHQPVLWKVYFKRSNFFKKIRTEIGETIESDKLTLENGSTC